MSHVPMPTPSTERAAAPGYRLRLTLLGHMDVRDAAGKSLLPRVRKSRAVLAVLALASPRPVLRERLAALLWSSREREQARASLRQCVHELQDLLLPLGADLLEADRNQLTLHGEGVWTDTIYPDVTAQPLLDDLGGLDPEFDRWLTVERRRLARGTTAVAEAALLLETLPGSDPSSAITAAERLLAIDPTHEGAWRALITAHAARGARGAAMATYERCAAALAEVANIAPSAQTQALLTAIRLDHPAPTARRTGRPPAESVRLGVMPFRALSTPDDEALAFGLADEITTALARFRWMFLVASPSVAAVSGATVSGDPVSGDRREDLRWRELALDFLLEGNVQRRDGKIRVTVRLLDLAAGGEIAWTTRFDRDDTDLLTLQDEIAAETVAAIDPELLLREGRRAAARPPSSATAYNLVLRAIPAIYHLEETSYRAAGRALEDAVALDPDYAAAHAWLACWLVFLVGQGWASDQTATMERAGMLAERAVRLDPADARGLTIAGHVEAFLHYRADKAMALHERAIDMNPNLPLAHAFSALALAYVGHHDEAIRRAEHARRLSPFDPHGFFFDNALMMPHLLRRDFEIAAILGRRSIQLNAVMSGTYKGLLSALGHLGRHEEIIPLRARLLELEPKFTVTTATARSPMRRAADRDLYLDGLRYAGIPE